MLCNYWCAKTSPPGDYILQTIANEETTNVNQCDLKKQRTHSIILHNQINIRIFARITGDGCVDSVLMCEGDVLLLITGDRLGS